MSSHGLLLMNSAILASVKPLAVRTSPQLYQPKWVGWQRTMADLEVQRKQEAPSARAVDSPIELSAKTQKPERSPVSVLCQAHETGSQSQWHCSYPIKPLQVWWVRA